MKFEPGEIVVARPPAYIMGKIPPNSQYRCERCSLMIEGDLMARRVSGELHLPYVLCPNCVTKKGGE
jgi:hypothetical protein